MSKLSENHVEFTGLASFQAYGIEPLTGEACAYGVRMLCDVNEDGLALLADYWGIPSLTLAGPMNSQVNGKPSVGSIMLSRDAWRSLTRFVAARSGALAVVHAAKMSSMVAVYDEELLSRYAELTGVTVERLYSAPGPAIGSRMVHQFTGRVH